MLTLNCTIRVLLVENDSDDIELINRFFTILGKEQFELVQFNRLQDGLAYLSDNLPDIILLDLNLPDSYGVQSIEAIKKITTEIPIVALAEIDNEEIALVALRSGIEDYLIKEEISPRLLKKSIVYACERKRASGELKQSLTESEARQSTERDRAFLIASLHQNQELLKTVIDNTSALIWMTEANGDCIFFNQAWLNFTASSLETELQTGWMARIHPEDLPRCNRAYQLALKKGKGFQVEYRLLRFDGKYRWMLNTAVCRHNHNGEFTGFIYSCLDINQRKRTEKKLARQAARNRILAKIIEQIHSSLNIEAILPTTIEEVKGFLQVEKISIAKVNPTNRQLTWLFESGSSELNHSQLKTPKKAKKAHFYPDFFPDFDRLAAGETIIPAQQERKSIEPTENIPQELRGPDPICSTLLIPIISNQQLWGLLYVQKCFSQRHEKFTEIKLLERVVMQLGVAIQQWEIHQKLERANQELEELSVVDGLTKIANRRKFDGYINGEWQRLAREKAPLSLILCDIDYFKLYNDTYGHQAGDRCLKLVAQAINHVIKRPADLVARYGGEEFAIILPNTNIIGAEYIAQQVRLKIESLQIPHINSPVDLYITLSLGVACYIPERNSASNALIAAADSSLYEAKALGRNRVVKFSGSDE